MQHYVYIMPDSNDRCDRLRDFQSGQITFVRTQSNQYLHSRFPRYLQCTIP